MFSWPIRSEHIRELLNNYCRHFLPIRLRQQTMTRTLNLDQSGWRRDQLNRRVQFLDRTKSVFSAADEQRRGMQVREMCRPKLGWFSGRMKRIREQEQSVNQIRIRSRQYAGLTPTVGLTAGVSPSGESLAQQRDRSPKSVLIALGTGGRWWPVGARLPEREVTAKYIDAGCGECFCEGDKQRCIAIPAGTVGEHQCITGWGGCTVDETSHGHLAGVLVHKRF